MSEPESEIWVRFHSPSECGKRVVQITKWFAAFGGPNHCGAKSVLQALRCWNRSWRPKFQMPDAVARTEAWNLISGFTVLSQRPCASLRNFKGFASLHHVYCEDKSVGVFKSLKAFCAVTLQLQNWFRHCVDRKIARGNWWIANKITICEYFLCCVSFEFAHRNSASQLYRLRTTMTVLLTLHNHWRMRTVGSPQREYTFCSKPPLYNWMVNMWQDRGVSSNSSVVEFTLLNCKIGFSTLRPLYEPPWRSLGWSVHLHHPRKKQFSGFGFRQIAVIPKQFFECDLVEWIQLLV